MLQEPSTRWMRRALSAVLVALLLAMAGCLSPKRKVAQQMLSLNAEWQAMVKRQSALPEREIAWPEAVEILNRDNLKLRAARVGITNASELAKQPYRDLIPTLTVRSDLTKTFPSFPSTSVNDITFNVDSFFNIPGVVNFDSRLFAGRLEVLRAEAAWLLAHREQTIALYKLFLQAREQDEIGAELKAERKLADAVTETIGVANDLLEKDLQAEELTLAKSREALQTGAGELLGDSQCRWILLTNDLPELDYAQHPLPLLDTNRVARLQIRLAALELVRAWAQLHGIKLQYWPELAIFVSGPSLYQRQDGQSQFWSASQASASADFFWNLDTRGYVRMQLRQTRRQQELELAELRQDSLDLVNRLVAAQRLNGSLQTQLERMERLSRLLEQVPPGLDVNSLMQRVGQNRTLRLETFRLRRELAETDTLFWFVDEDRWVESPVQTAQLHSTEGATP